MNKIVDMSRLLCYSNYCKADMLHKCNEVCAREVCTYCRLRSRKGACIEISLALIIFSKQLRSRKGACIEI